MNNINTQHERRSSRDMKRKIGFILVCVLIVSVFSVQAPVDAAKNYAVVQEENDRSFVPVRYVAETFGYEVDWDGVNKRVKISNEDSYVDLFVNRNTAIVNGEQKQLDAAPVSLQDTIYVPLRFVAEQLGSSINVEKGKIKLKNDKFEATIEMVSYKRFEKAIKSPVTTQSMKINTSSKSISVNVVSVDLYNPTLNIDAYYANNKIGSVEPFKNMVEKSKAKVAVNGTFFNAYSETDVKVPYGYIVKDGETINQAPTEMRAVFVYTKDSEVKVLNVHDFKEHLFESKIKTAIQAGPLLVKNEEIVVDPVAEGFKDPKILTNRGARSAIGITKDNKLIIVTTNGASIPEVAEVMLKLDAVEAMNLDGGASSALYASGKYITPAGRELSNILTIHY